MPSSPQIEVDTHQAHVTLAPVSGRTIVEATELGAARLIRYQGADKKWRLVLRIGDREIPMIRRVAFSEEFVTNWQLFCAIGLPVVPTLRYDAATQTVYVTDLTADGSCFYGKSGLTFIDLERWNPESLEEPRNSARDQQFIELYETNLATIKQTVSSIADTATKHLILLPHDDPFDLLVHPDGTYNIYILDLALGGYLRNIRDAANLPSFAIEEALDVPVVDITLDFVQNLTERQEKAVIKRSNEASVVFFLGTLEMIYGSLVEKH